MAKKFTLKNNRHNNESGFKLEDCVSKVIIDKNTKTDLIDALSKSNINAKVLVKG